MSHRIRLSIPMLALVSLTALGKAPDLGDHPMIGELAPAFELQTVAGESLSLEQLEGSYVVLHFGASW